MILLFIASKVLSSEDINTYKVEQHIQIPQAKVVIYRGNTHDYAANNLAKIYFNDKLIANISPNDYLEFCIPSGKNIIGSNLQSSILYSKKNQKKLLVDFQGGSNYYLMINDDNFKTAGEIYQYLDSNLQDSIYNGKKLKNVYYDNFIQKCQPADIQVQTIEEPDIAVIPNKMSSISF